ncbi:ABC transporter permease [Amycolatopsis albispora]|uniref:Transport permease protein n=1 Tax=Amycolatopsis albispora TaxID=1804986 RepID=A0A344LHW8_9PSEU|nr:ABC transporter permease [Amycolatopsis albispora]AXB47642.1 ABC transporter [Amycolatopsis albispora]
MTTAESLAPVRPLQRGRLQWAITDTLVLTKRSLRHIPRIPDQLIFATVNPIIFVLLFRYVFGGAIGTPGMTYPDFLMAGIFVQTVAFGAVNSGVGLAEDMSRGLVNRFRSLPMAPSAVLTGRILADVVRNSIIIVTGVLIGLVVGFRPTAGVGGWVAAIALLLLVSLTFSWVSSTIGLMVRNAEGAQSANYIWLLPLTFASSAFVPTESMPAGLRAFADYQPITVIVDAVRGFLLDEPLGWRGWGAFAWCVALVAICAPIAVRKFQRRAMS